MIQLSLAPFQGITDVVYRNLFSKHFDGIDKFYTPFFSGIQTDNSRNLRVEEIDPQLNNVNILTPQILSNDADEIIRFAKQCKSLGYNEFNLNMGCPFPRVANKTRGSGLMAAPDKVLEIFDKVFSNIDNQFSLKCRLGYYDPDEIMAFIDAFNKYPFSEIIIHPRIGKQLYSDHADIERFGQLILLINKPLVYNGDIFTIEDFKRLHQKFPSVSMFMLGRGLLTNPLLAEEIKGKEINAAERKRRLHDFVVALFEERLHHAGGSPKIIGCMKELWTYMMNNFEEPQVIWRKIKKINNIDVYEETVEVIFRDNKLRDFNI